MALTIDDSIKVQYNQDGTVKAIYDYDFVLASWTLEDFSADRVFSAIGDSIVITEYKDGLVDKIEIYSPFSSSIVDPNPSIAGVILYRSSRTVIEGNDDRDILNGSSFNDDIYCGGGNDDAFGGSGDDNISGGSGNDKIRGGSGRDTINGNLGLDTADYSDKTSSVVVSLSGSTSVQVNVGGILEDSISNIECLIGGSSSDSFSGDSMANQFIGHAGDDRLYGFGGDDTLDGGSSNDELRGGLGLDRLTGGLDSDRFRFDTAASTTSANRDLITDFSSSSGDRLSFSKTVYVGFGTATAITSSHLRVGAGVIAASTTTQRFLYDTTTGILRFDGDGSGTAYAALQVAQLGASTTHPTLAYTDFILI